MSRYGSALWLACTLTFTFGYFYQAGGWNQNTRFDLVRAIVEERRIEIDTFHQNTGDKSRFGGHFYADKAPGQSFLAVPFVACVHVVLAQARIDPASELGIELQTHVATLATAAIPTALSALCLVWLAGRLGAPRDAAAFTGIAFALCTPALPYATLLFAHALSACCLLLSFCALVAGAEAHTSRGRFAYGLASGLAAGWAVLVEYHAGPVAVLLALAHLRRGEAADRRLAPALSGVALGAAVCLAIFAAYHAAAFGSPFRIGYDSKLSFQEMGEGVFGVTYPRWERLWAILFGPQRGLLPLAPFLLAAPVGALALLRDQRTRWVGGLALAIGVYFVLLHASFVNWQGGWAYGPRYLMPGLPFLCLPLAIVWTRARTYPRVLLLVLAVVGGALNLLATAVNPLPPEGYREPFRELYVPALRRGDFPVNRQSYLDLKPRRGPDSRVAAWNLGTRFGLKGLASLVPLALFWVVAAPVGWWLRRATSASAVTDQST